jgi:hypothetical protein
MNAFVAGPGERLGDRDYLEEELDPGERMLHDLEVTLSDLRADYETRGEVLRQSQEENRILRGALRRMGVDVAVLLQRPVPEPLDVPF